MENFEDPRFSRKDAELARPIFDRLYARAIGLLRQEYMALGYSMAEWQELESSVRQAESPDENATRFGRTVLAIISQGRVKNPSEINGVARAFQAADNHLARPSPLGVTLSPLLFNAMKESWACGCSVPKNWLAYLLLADEAHEAIDRYFLEWQKKKRRDSEKLRIRYERMFGKKEAVEFAYKFDPRLASVAHHVLDWILQVDPFNAYRKTPEKLAAIAIDVEKTVNQQATGYAVSELDRKDLASFAGYASQGSLASASSRSFYDVICSVRDAEMLLIDPVGAPKDWRKKLPQIAFEKGGDRHEL